MPSSATEIDQKKFLDLCKELHELYIDFATELEARGKLDVTVDTKLIANVATRYLLDINAYRAYHGSKNTHASRKATYLIKWICKLKPIAACGDSKVDVFINEDFALYVASVFIDVELPSLDAHVYDLLMDALRYQNFSEHTLIPFFAHLME